MLGAIVGAIIGSVHEYLGTKTADFELFHPDSRFTDDSVLAIAVAECLMDAGSFSGWGIRTIHAAEARYNPMSYHNGSIWPHDNALIGVGLARYGFRAETSRIFEGLFAASTYVDLRRLPELFCGFVKRPANGPTFYPVSCIPQRARVIGCISGIHLQSVDTDLAAVKPPCIPSAQESQQRSVARQRVRSPRPHTTHRLGTRLVATQSDHVVVRRA